MEQYLVSVAIKKGIWAFAKGLTSFIVSAKMAPLEANLGIHVDPATFQAGVGALLFTAQHMLHDWAKVHYPDQHWL